MKQNHHVVLLGATQTGKSNTMIFWGRTQLKYGFTVTVINTKGEDDITKQCVYRQPSITQYEELLRANVTNGLIEIKPKFERGNLIDQIEDYFTILLKVARETNIPHIVIIDEIHKYQNKASASEAIKNIWLMGLGLNLLGVAVSQRPQHIHNDIFHDSLIFILHQLTRKDLGYCYDSNYMDIPREWSLPASNPDEAYPFTGKIDDRGISHDIMVKIGSIAPWQKIDIEPLW